MCYDFPTSDKLSARQLHIKKVRNRVYTAPPRMHRRLMSPFIVLCISERSVNRVPMYRHIIFAIVECEVSIYLYKHPHDVCRLFGEEINMKTKRSRNSAADSYPDDDQSQQVLEFPLSKNRIVYRH